MLEINKLQFIQSFNAVAKEAHDNAKAKGFYDRPVEDGTRLALIHSEVSEALEALRQGNPPDDKVSQFTGAEAELADVVIRIMDLAQFKGWRVGEAVIEKMQMNATRSRMHGGKKF